MKVFKYLPIVFALGFSLSTVVFAQQKPCATAVGCPKTAPEVDATLAISGVALLGGAIAVLRARRRK